MINLHTNRFLWLEINFEVCFLGEFYILQKKARCNFYYSKYF